VSEHEDLSPFGRQVPTCFGEAALYFGDCVVGSIVRQIAAVMWPLEPDTRPLVCMEYTHLTTNVWIDYELLELRSHTVETIDNGGRRPEIGLLSYLRYRGVYQLAAAISINLLPVISEKSE